jgi:hypothetical protein
MLQLDLSLPLKPVYALLTHCFHRHLLLMSSRRLVPSALFAPWSAALFAAFALVACSSPSGPELRASSPVIYVSSQRSPSDVFSCLEDKLPSLSTSRTGGASELLVGPNAWLVTLTPSQYGSTVKVQKSEGDYGGLPEPEMRVDIARCTT